MRGQQHIEVFFALAAADDFADPAARARPIARTVFSVVVALHVERLSAVRGVVVNDGRLLEVLLGEVPLMLRLQVGPPRTPGTPRSCRP